MLKSRKKGYPSHNVGEHTGLLRALRTEHTLNLTRQLVRYLRHEGAKPEHGRHDSDRDLWTRWSLPDAPPSDWDLEDEIGVMINCQFVNKRHDLRRSPDLDEEEEEYVENLTRQLTPILVHFLDRILVLVEGHMFPRPPSLQDRINPLNWRDLANILASPAASDLIDRRLLERYIHQMECLLGAEGSESLEKLCPQRAIERCNALDQDRARRRDRDDRLMSSLFQHFL